MKLNEINIGYKATQDWLREQGIADYTLDAFNVANVHEEVIIESSRLKDRAGLPIQFGTVDGNFNADDCDLHSFKGCPRTVIGYFVFDGNKPSSFEGMPSKVGRFVSLDRCGLTTLSGIHEHLKEMDGTLFLQENDIKSGLLDVLRIKGCISFRGDNLSINEIINKYLEMQNPEDHIFDCQSDFIDAGLEEYV